MNRSQRRRQERLDRWGAERARPQEWLVWGTGGAVDVFGGFWRRAAGGRDTDLIGLIHDVDPQWEPPGDDQPGGVDRRDESWMTIVRGANEADVVEELADLLGAEVRGFLCLTLVTRDAGELDRPLARRSGRDVLDRRVVALRRRAERRRDRERNRRRWAATARPWLRPRSRPGRTRGSGPVGRSDAVVDEDVGAAETDLVPG